MRRLLLLAAAVATLAAIAAGLAAWTGGEVTTAAAKGFVPGLRASKATIWAVGDGAGGPGSKQVAALIAGRSHARFLYLGDVYEHGTAEEYRTNYAPSFGRLASVTAPTPGNHEWANRSSGYIPYWRKARGTTVPSWYAFSVAGWRLLSLNSEASHGRGSEQVRWLRRRVSVPGTCRIAFWHRPRWSGGTHGDQTDVAPLWNALRGHAALVLAGHDHDMQHFRRRDGIVSLVAGSGGRGHYPVDRRHAGLRWANDTSYGALRIRLSRGLAEYAFVAAGGRVLHTGRVRCSPS